MEIFFKLLIASVILVWVWFSIIASVVVFKDATLQPVQMVAQALFAWCLPVVSALLVLFLVVQHSPELVPKKLLPWPFKRIVFGKKLKSNRNRDENKDSGIDLRAARSREQRFEEGVGSDGYGDGD